MPAETKEVKLITENQLIDLLEVIKYKIEKRCEAKGISSSDLNNSIRDTVRNWFKQLKTSTI